MKKALVLLMTVISAVFARSTAGGYGCFGPSLALINFDNINKTFRDNKVEELSSQHWMFGGGGYALVNRIMIGGAGWGGTQSVTSESLNLFCQVNYGGGEFRAGYAVLDLKNLLLVPTLGIGGGGYSINLGPYNQTVPNFDSLLHHPGRTSTVDFSGFTLNPQLAIVIPISFVGVEIRGGYCFGPLAGDWKFADRGVLAKGPEMAKANPWFSLNVLLGGFSREKTQFKGKIELEGGEEKEEEEKE
ncbi:MAG: hypothetical protein ABIK23_05725 [candidate division WOR-3 bacterium]